MTLNMASFFAFAGIVITGTVLKCYTRRRLSDIDGLGPIIHQDLEKEHIVAAIGDEKDST
jgi:hypothetical protein